MDSGRCGRCSARSLRPRPRPRPAAPTRHGSRKCGASGKENFEEHGADAERRQIVPGRSWAAWARALGHLLPPLEIADLGCGDGYLTVEAAHFARRVIAIDRSEEALDRARDMARRLARRSLGEGGRLKNVEWKRGEIEKLPLEDASVDVALLSQALHHAAHPSAALAEAVRIVRPGGRVLVLDLRSHDERWVRERLGDRWLGFDDEELRRLLAQAGLADIKVSVGTRRQRDPFTVLLPPASSRESTVRRATAGTQRSPRKSARPPGKSVRPPGKPRRAIEYV